MMVSPVKSAVPMETMAVIMAPARRIPVIIRAVIAVVGVVIIIAVIARAPCEHQRDQKNDSQRNDSIFVDLFFTSFLKIIIIPISSNDL